jgi:hypothetical protein
MPEVRPLSMSDTTSQIESLVQTLRTGHPRTAWLAGLELIRFGRAAEARLIYLLREVSDTHRILGVLSVLRGIKISDPVSVDAVVRLLWRKQALVRRSAASCLLVSSPKLRRHLAQIRAALDAEKDETVREYLRKLLDRYPKTRG